MDLQKFWDKREPQHRWSLPENDLSKQIMGDLVEWIRALYIGEEPRILDVGCGWGRLYAYLSKEVIESDVTMVDFTTTALHLCEEMTGHRPDLWDGKKLPYEDDSFNLVVLMELTLHIHPDHIKEVIDEAFRVSNQYVYITTLEWDQPEVKEDTWCFAHDYMELLGDADIVMAKTYPAKKKLSAVMMRVPRVEKTIMEAIEEQIDDDYLQEVEREDEGSTERERTSSSDESSVSDDPEVG